MAYCTAQDVRDRCGEHGVRVQFDDDATGTLSAGEEAMFQRIIDEIAADIDNVLKCRVSSPRAWDGNATLKNWAVALASERVAMRKGNKVMRSFERIADRVRDEMAEFAAGRMVIDGIVTPTQARPKYERARLGLPRVARRA